MAEESFEVWADGDTFTVDLPLTVSEYLVWIAPRAEWLCQPEQSGRWCALWGQPPQYESGTRMVFHFTDQNTAFAFKMRWAGGRG